MRILLVTPDYPPPPGGIQTLTRNLERGLESLNHEVGLVHIQPNDVEFPRDLVPQVMVNGIKAIPKWPYFNRVYRELKKAIQDFSPDVVHVMHIVCWPALQVAKEEGIPSVTSVHALELSMSHLVSAAASHTTCFHSVSQFTSNLLREVTQSDQSSIYVVPPSIDIPETLPSPTPNGPVFSISRLVERKNVDTLIEAWGQLPIELREKHNLVIAGDGDQRQSLEIQASQDETIKLLGRISETRKRELLQEAAVFALAPVRQGFDVEGFGIVYLEAQAHGTPVLGSSTGGVPEAVGSAGHLVESPRDSTIISAHLQRLLADGKFRDACYESITDRIHNFSLETVAKRHIDRYESLLE